MLSRPSRGAVELLRGLRGDILVLGAGGKIGPSLVKLAKNAIDKAGIQRRILAASRFSRPDARRDLEAAGIETISCDLLDRESLEPIPDVQNIIYMVGMKFGTEGNQPLTWATNAYIPAIVAQKFRRSRIVVFSTGNVYPLVPVESGGARESHQVGPIGEYAQSCLGRERIFEYFSTRYGTRALFLRLNYAIDLRYGVLLDVAQKVLRGVPVDLAMGYVNVIWQGDVNDAAIRCLALCSDPPRILNVTGPETISIRWLATRFGELFGEDVTFEGTEPDMALLSDASEFHHLLGHPSVNLDRMIRWVAHWVSIGGQTLNRPTHFEERGGRF